MEKAEKRQILKGLQAIVSGRGDDEVPQVIADLQKRLDELSSSLADDGGTRKKRGTRDRKETSSRDRSGG